MMKSKKYFILMFICFFYINLKPEQFFYPVAYNQSTKLIYVIYQKSLHLIELWTYDYENKLMQRGLLSTYSPGALRILPDGKAFSFIDQGKLRIKQIIKRSPKTINFSKPVYDIGLVEWIDNNTCYFSAKRKNHLSVFEGNIESQIITCIKEKKLSNCMYPQKIDKELFFIEQTADNKYKIIKTAYLQNNNNEETLLNSENYPIAFLKMVSQTEGFFISHPESINRQEKNINFSYHRLIKNNNIWQPEILFTFNLPIDYLFGNNNQRLYESILPFLPKHHNNKIYFCNFDSDTKSIDIYSFNMLKRNIERKTNASGGEIFFAPLVIGGQVFYGNHFNGIDNETKIDDSEKPFFLSSFQDDEFVLT